MKSTVSPARAAPALRVLALIAVALAAGCGGKGTGGGSDVTATPPPDTAAASPDSAQYGIVITPPRDSTSGALSEPVLSSGHLIPGWRVQIFTSSWLADAEALRDRLRERGIPAYVEYRSPLYRVRIGDCTDLAEARDLRDQAIAMGYERASVVSTLVQAPRTDPDSSARP